MSLSKGIDAYILKVQLELNKAVTYITRELYRSVVYLTPSPAHPGDTAKGLLANQYYLAVGVNNFSSDVGTNVSINGASSLGRIEETLSQNLWLGKDNTVSMTNNISYAYRAEYLGWPAGDSSGNWHWSGRVGPYKMISQSVNKIKGMLT